MDLLAALYLAIGVMLAGVWTERSALRHFGGLVTFLVVTLAWPVMVLGLVIATRNY